VADDASGSEDCGECSVNMLWLRTGGRRGHCARARLAALLLGTALLAGACSAGSGGIGGSDASEGAGPGGIDALGPELAQLVGDGADGTTASPSRTKTPEAAIRTLSPDPGSPLGFSTPTKNIACAMDTESVRCDIHERTWRPPPRPSSCQLDYGNALSLGDEGAEIVCTGGITVDENQTEVLAYGHGIHVDTFECTSLKAGVTCRDLETGHGFTLAREAYALF
jgi:hypothetical protein